MEVEELLHLYKKFYCVLMGNRKPEKMKAGMLERVSVLKNQRYKTVSC